MGNSREFPSTKVGDKWVESRLNSQKISSTHVKPIRSLTRMIAESATD